MSKPLRSAIPFRVPQDGVLEEGLSSAYEPVPVKSSVAPSGLCLTESEGNPEELVPTSGFPDGIEFPMEKKSTSSFLANILISVYNLNSLIHG